MKIDELLLNPGIKFYYDSKFRIVLEDHMTYLKNLPSTQSVPVNMGLAYKYEGDFFGLLTAMNVRPDHHYIVMRMNNMSSPLEYTHEMMNILIPGGNEIERILSAYRTKNKT